MFRKKTNQKSSDASKSGIQEQPDALKKKTVVASSEAAAISIIIHVLLIVFAGSVVAIKYILKPPAEFEGKNIDRPKLERRELQMPTKVKNLQQKSSRPRVTSRMAVATKQSFSLPDMSNLDIGFDRSGRSVGGMGMTGNLGFGISGINFFGAKSKGEKVVFVLDASKAMMEDSKGGYNTYKFAKDRVGQMIDRMSSATLFNVMVYTGYKGRSSTVMFRNTLVPATPENRAAIKEWLAPLNSDVNNLENLKDLPRPYNGDGRKYDTGVTRLPDFIGPIQAAMEQKADNIFILCKGWGEMRMSEEDAFTLRGAEPGDRDTDPEELAEKRALKEESDAKARQILEEENRARAAKGEPPKVISNWRSYVTDELRLPYPNWGSFIVNFSLEELLAHLEAVYSVNYKEDGLKKPAIHIVKLIAADGIGVDPAEGRKDQDAATQRFNNLKRLAKEFRGEFELLRGAQTVEDLLKQNNLGAESGF